MCIAFLTTSRMSMPFVKSTRIAPTLAQSVPTAVQLRPAANIYGRRTAHGKIEVSPATAEFDTRNFSQVRMRYMYECARMPTMGSRRLEVYSAQVWMCVYDACEAACV